MSHDKKSHKSSHKSKKSGKKTSAGSTKGSEPDILPSDFNNRFEIHRKIGQGSFGDVMKGYDKKEKKIVAIKIETRNIVSNKSSSVLAEGRMYRALDSEPKVDPSMKMIPRLLFCDTVGNKNILVMEMLGSNLERLLAKCPNKKFSLKTTLLLADQLLERIEFIHEHRILHRDIKPENFVIGYKTDNHLETRNQIRVLDFGLSKFYMNAEGHHIPLITGKQLTGTARYVSIRTHDGIEQSRRDDLESIGHLLIYFLKGTLPWVGLKTPSNTATRQLVGKQKNKLKYELIAKVKKEIPLNELCSGIPKEFMNLMQHARNELDFEEKPEYAKIRGSFKKIFDSNGYQNDHLYDWDFLADHRRPGSVVSMTEDTVTNIKNQGSDIRLTPPAKGSPTALTTVAKSPSPLVTSRSPLTKTTQGFTPPKPTVKRKTRSEKSSRNDI